MNNNTLTKIEVKNLTTRKLLNIGIPIFYNGNIISSPNLYFQMDERFIKYEFISYLFPTEKNLKNIKIKSEYDGKNSKKAFDWIYVSFSALSDNKLYIIHQSDLKNSRSFDFKSLLPNDYGVFVIFCVDGENPFLQKMYEFHSDEYLQIGGDLYKTILGSNTDEYMWVVNCYSLYPEPIKILLGCIEDKHYQYKIEKRISFSPYNLFSEIPDHHKLNKKLWIRHKFKTCKSYPYMYENWWKNSNDIIIVYRFNDGLYDGDSIFKYFEISANRKIWFPVGNMIENDL